MFWKQGDSSIRQKLHIYDAVIRSKLMYGLESTVLNTSVLKRIDAFQMKGFRKILNRPTAYYDRTYSNNKLLEEASCCLDPSGHRKVKLLSDFHADTRKQLLAKLVALGDAEPGFQIIFQSGTFLPHSYGGRRVGRPRLNWLEQTIGDLWEETKLAYPHAR